MRLHDRTRGSADTPDIVRNLPGRDGRASPVTTNPLHRKLPRP